MKKTKRKMTFKEAIKSITLKEAINLAVFILVVVSFSKVILFFFVTAIVFWASLVAGFPELLLDDELLWMINSMIESITYYILISVFGGLYLLFAKEKKK